MDAAVMDRKVPGHAALLIGLALADEAAVVDLRSHGLRVHDEPGEVYVPPCELIDNAILWLVERGLASLEPCGRRVRLAQHAESIGRSLLPHAG